MRKLKAKEERILKQIKNDFLVTVGLLVIAFGFSEDTVKGHIILAILIVASLIFAAYSAWMNYNKLRACRLSQEQVNIK